ncbi:glycosyltransferase family 2 protein [Alteromonas lipotrueiana]|uniref:glycosyltransferase family 2 protein n=1 Tax=Alteromonas lipotrueiana TaxID=2803815 RepID=UPI001C484570|nr:glycosyltransferase family 2 protein [Alteromonas lipotrueiana]
MDIHRDHDLLVRNDKVRIMHAIIVMTGEKMLRKLLVSSLLEPYLPISRLKHSLKFTHPKVRLVAVAKNEARYLAEWILHHLYFGIADIEVHYNQCDDNTVQMGEYLSKHYPVTFINADEGFKASIKSPQVRIYRNALRRSYNEGFSHVLFLDVDEFLVPKDLEKSIPEMLLKKKKFDVVCSNWANKLNDRTVFGRAVENKLSLELSPTVKSCVKSFVEPPVMNPHTVVSSKLRYGMTGQAEFTTNRDDMSKVEHCDEVFKKCDFLVVHRQYRSELEYVAMLGRGRPIEEAKRSSIFKNNRRGYNVHTNAFDLTFPEQAYANYSYYLEERLADAQLQQLLETAEKSVLERFATVKNMIADAPAEEAPLLKRLLKNVTLVDIKTDFSGDNTHKEKLKSDRHAH